MPAVRMRAIKVLENRPSMDVFKKKSPQVVKAPPPKETVSETHREGEMTDLVGAIASEHGTVQSDTQHLETQRKYRQRLELLRQGKKTDSLIGSLLSSQDDKVQDAQIELNRSMGRLMQKSMELLVANTSVAGLHGAQQREMQEQQKLLQQQADAIKLQNQKLLEQQETIRQQQKAIHTAHQGLLEAKGITREHAQQLVGCVKQATEVEQKLAIANLHFRSGLEKNVQEAVKQCLDQLNAGFSDLDRRHSGFKEQTASTLRAQSQQTAEQLALFASDSASFQARTEQKLQGHIHSLAEQAAARHAQLVRQQETSTTQLKEFVHNRTQDVMAIMDRKTLALHESIHGFERALEASAQEQTRLLQAQRASFERSLQHLAVDLKGCLAETRTLGAGLRDNVDAVSALRHQVISLQAQQQAVRLMHRRALVVVAGLAIASLGWQIARHFTGS